MPEPKPDPKPVPLHVVCSECGLPWDAHIATGAARKGNPKSPGPVSPSECIRLLKAELAQRPTTWYTGNVIGASGYTYTINSIN